MSCKNTVIQAQAVEPFFLEDFHIGAFNKEHISELRKLPARQLLSMLQRFRKFAGDCDFCNRDTFDCEACKQSSMPFNYTEAEIKFVLAFKPHVPNKIESKRARQLRAKHCRTYDKRKNRTIR